MKHEVKKVRELPRTKYRIHQDRAGLEGQSALEDRQPTEFFSTADGFTPAFLAKGRTRVRLSGTKL